MASKTFPFAVLAHGCFSSRPPTLTSNNKSFTPQPIKHLRYLCVNHRLSAKDNGHMLVSHFFKSSTWRRMQSYEDARSQDILDEQDRLTDEVIGNENNGRGSFLAKVAIVLGIAATATIISICLKWPVLGSSLGIQFLAEGSSSSVMAAPPVGFTFKAFGYNVVLPEYAPGWIYFWLLMAAGCGLFISEEALNIWVGITLARLLTLDGTWHSFTESFSRNAPYIISSILWVYCFSGNQGHLMMFVRGRTIFPRSEKSNSFPSRGHGYFSRVLLCWSLLWWLDHSSPSVRDWILVEGASCGCPCYSCNSSGNLDCFPICCGCFNGIIPFPATPLLLLVLIVVS
ncbi:uncharacterized protein LOC115959529 isoform X5 [Quercus lobata]|uniref:uncharacterized protein LOC115959529 isoform X5 n=1 Tax=Quercus lobata TaxID=97700 RepID=UPI0012451939|nr:uncharacterized protein LOC115959529 isoform X5 [Quercus lobata]